MLLLLPSLLRQMPGHDDYDDDDSDDDDDDDSDWEIAETIAIGRSLRR